VIRFRYSGTHTPPYNTLIKFLLTFTVADSTAAGVSVSLDTDPGSGRGASFVTAKSIDSTTAMPLETIVIDGPAEGNTVLLLQREAGKNSVSGTFFAGLTRYRMNLEADIRITW